MYTHIETHKKHSKTLIESQKKQQIFYSYLHKKNYSQ